MSRYSIEFDFHGRRQSLDIHAADWAEAERKLWMLKANGEVAGRIIAEIPVSGWIARAWAWVWGK